MLAGLVVLALLAALGLLALPLINWYTDVRGTAYGSPEDTHSGLNPRGFTEECQQLRNRADHVLVEVYETLGPESDDDVTEAAQRRALRALRDVASEPLAREYERWARTYELGGGEWGTPTKFDFMRDFEFRIWDEHDCSYYPPDEPSPRSP